MIFAAVSSFAGQRQRLFVCFRAPVVFALNNSIDPLLHVNVVPFVSPLLPFIPLTGEGLSQHDLCAALMSLLSQQATECDGSSNNNGHAGRREERGGPGHQRYEAEGVQERGPAALQRLPAREAPPPVPPAAGVAGSGSGPLEGVGGNGKQEREKIRKEGSGGGMETAAHEQAVEEEEEEKERNGMAEAQANGEVVTDGVARRVHLKLPARSGSLSPLPLGTAGGGRGSGGGGGDADSRGAQDVEQEKHGKVADVVENNRREKEVDQEKIQALDGGEGKESGREMGVAVAEKGGGGVGGGGIAAADVRRAVPTVRRRPRRRSSGILPESVISKV